MFPGSSPTPKVPDPFMRSISLHQVFFIAPGLRRGVRRSLINISRRKTAARRIRHGLGRAVTSTRGGEDMSPDTTLDGAIAKSIGQRVGCGFCRVLEARRVAGLDLTSQWRSLAIRDGCISRRRGSARVIDCFDRNTCKTRGDQFLANFCDIVIAVRGAGHEQWWIVREDRGQRLGHRIGKFVFVDFGPYVEAKTTTRLEHAAGLPIALDLVREEHDAELARNDVEFLILERQGERVGLPPCDATLKSFRRSSSVKH